MYHKEKNLIFVAIPKCGTTSIIRSLRGLEHNENPMSQDELKPMAKYGDLRHPTFSQIVDECKKDMHFNGFERVITSIRNPVDRWLSIKAFLGGNDQSGLKLGEPMLKSMMYRLLHRGYDYMTEGAENVEIIRFESLEEDCKRILDIDVGFSNKTKSPKQQEDLSAMELDLIKKLNPFEWELYNL